MDERMKRPRLLITILACTFSLGAGIAIGGGAMFVLARRQVDESTADMLSGRLFEYVQIRELTVVGKTNAAIEMIQDQIAANVVALSTLTNARPQVLRARGLIDAARSLKKFPFAVEPTELDERFKDVLKQLSESR